MKKKFDENNLVVQSNTLIEATYSMTVNEIKIFEACVSQVDSRATLEKDRVFTITIKDAQSIFNDDKNVYSQLKTVSERLFRREAKIKLGDQKYVLTHFLDWVEYDDKDYILKIKFAERVVPYISQLESHFTKYRIKYTKKLSSIYSHRIYQILVSWLGQGKNFMEIELDALRSMLADGKYKKNNDFRVYVLDVALAEINAHTDIQMEMLLLKRRKSFDGVQFKFRRKQEAAKAEEVRAVEREEKHTRNIQQKAKRIGLAEAEAKGKAIRLSLDDFDKYPTGTVFKASDGNTFIKTSNGVLLGEKEGTGSIPPAIAVKLIEAGTLSGVFS